ncbi:exosortase [Aphanothece sacrum FPU1]|uniref:Exosortase n=2 Tax=Aphanothece sacrum TaxID=1122 RepID=A0A401IDQ6_APHSA|nr:exosortase [Aphanothece sacrum FPU1]GBF86633.1 exosortase [Aphanothece sacrum FPU3]
MGFPTSQGTASNKTEVLLGCLTGIKGKRNGEKIIGLQPTGTPIPGNEPFNVDNLISLNAQQLTGDGFGFLTKEGNYASPFFASFLPTPGYLEVFSAPPFIPGPNSFGPEDSELSISFSASIKSFSHSSAGTVPEPLTILGAGTAMGFGSFFKRKLTKTKNNKA